MTAESDRRDLTEIQLIEPCHNIIFYNDTNSEVFRINKEGRFILNRERFPNALPDDFAKAFIEIIEKHLFDSKAVEGLIDKAEEWCATNAYDADKGVCDEHTVDDCRGRVNSAQELLDYLKSQI